MKLNWLQFIFASLLVTILVGCDDPIASGKKKQGDKGRSEYGQLPGLRSTHNEFLRLELARLESEEATPKLLSTGDKWNPSTAQPTTREERLLGLIARGGAGVLADRAEKLLPTDRFEFNTVRLRRATDFRDRYVTQQTKLREILDQGDLDFRIQHTKGLFARFDFIDALRLGIRLEMIEAGWHLANDKPDKALRCVGYCFQLLEQMAKQPHVIPRIRAVHLRRDVLRVVAALVENPNTNRQIQELAADLFDRQILNWPSDEIAWIGDRAQGLHTYEIVRDGYFTSLLTEAEVEEYKQQSPKMLKGVNQLVMKGIDEDERFYLQRMRQVIDSCQQPYYLRDSLLTQIEEDLRLLRDTVDSPRIADLFLFGDLREGQHLQAMDRALVEAWWLALKTACEQTVEIQTSPLTGEPYIVEKTTVSVKVSGFAKAENDHLIVVPIREAFLE
jgi:hypothetical protein